MLPHFDIKIIAVSGLVAEIMLNFQHLSNICPIFGHQLMIHICLCPHLFMSESWERENLTLDQIINLEDHDVISNVHQRRGVGGRPAIIVNRKKYDVQNLTNTLIPIIWGVEAVWCILTPRNVRHDSKIQKIACAAIYSKPDSRNKSKLLDHLSEAFHILNTKYGQGLHFCIAGDTNDLRLKPILDLSPNFVQVVQKPTRIDPKSGKEAILDPVIMSLANLYQEPEILAPLDPDPDKNGKPSDHKIVLVKPISAINNKCARVTRNIKVRPMTDSGIDLMRNWLIGEEWKNVEEAKTAHEKAELFQNTLVEKYNACFPEKTRQITSDDQPWIDHKLKSLDRKRKRLFHKERRSEKWKKLDKIFKKEIKSAKTNFYKKMVADLKDKNIGQLYSTLKRMTSYENKSEQLNVDEINHLSDQDQCEKIADEFSFVQNLYNALYKYDIQIPPLCAKDIPQFCPSQVWLKLSKMKINKSTIDGDLPAKLFRTFAAYFAEPLADIINTSIRRGEYPDIWKFEVITAIPKTHPVLKVSDLRNISGLLNCDKIAEKLLSELIISDMQATIDPAQYGNQRGKSINHYLIKMINRILTSLDNNSRRQTFAVVANLIDWSKAFPRQCPKLGVQSFIDNGVRPGLIPVLINYFQNRKMCVKWHGCKSVPRIFCSLITLLILS